MNCHYCGAELSDRSGFCLCCGTRQEKTSTVAVRIPEQTHPEDALPEPDEALLAAEFPTDFSLSMERAAPALKLPEERRLWKMVLFGILTLGIYPTVIWSRMVTELNIAASRWDGRRSVSYFGMLLLLPVTLGIYAFVWMHRFCARIGDELRRRDTGYTFGAKDFWLWNVLGALILVGPFVFTHRLMKAMNRINADFNIRG